MMGLSDNELHHEMQRELEQLDATLVMLDGKLIKPSKCYHLSASPAHILYNTNCPDDLKTKVDAILRKYKLPH